MTKPLTVVVALACAGLACVKVDGGAVELSWAIRSTTGAAITDCNCANPPIATVRLVLVGRGAPGSAIEGTTPCAGQAQCDFPCERQTGATAFDIKPTAPGEAYEMSVVAVDKQGQEIPKEAVATPALILLNVASGQPTEAGAFQLVANCQADCSMNGSGVCARP